MFDLGVETVTPCPLSPLNIVLILFVTRETPDGRPTLPLEDSLDESMDKLLEDALLPCWLGAGEGIVEEAFEPADESAPPLTGNKLVPVMMTRLLTTHCLGDFFSHSLWHRNLEFSRV